MLNISKYCQALVVGSAVTTAAIASFIPAASAQTAQTNNSNASGSNVTTITNPSISPSTSFSNGGSTPSVGSYSPTTVSQAGSVTNSLNTAQSNYDRAAAALAEAETAQPNAANTQPVRYGREAGDLANCGCLNADTVGTNPAPRPDLVAARAKADEAAAELAKAKAEARQFIESVKDEPKAVKSSGFIQIW